MSAHTQAVAGFVEAFATQEKTRRNTPAWLTGIRHEALRRFEEIGFPGPKDEAWKYTSVAPILGVPFHAALTAPLVVPDLASVRTRIAALALPADAVVAVFVNGRFTPELSRVDMLGETAEFRSLGADLERGDSIAESKLGAVFQAGTHGFAALNSAFVDDGAVIRVKRGGISEHPIHFVFCEAAANRPTVSHLRNVVVCEAGATATLVEHYVGDPGAHLTNAATEIVVEQGATLNHVKLQSESEDAFHVGRTEVLVGEGAAYHSHVVTLGARLSRTELRIKLAGRNAESHLFGLYVLDGESHGDHHTWIDHEVADTKSFENYKGVLRGESRGVFTGHVLVRRDAQHIEARQSNKNLLLSDAAVVETRPQLEIYADDVQCSHGAAIGRLDESAIFYLRQRGLDVAGARALLTWGFAAEILQGLPTESLRTTVANAVRTRIRGGDTDVAVEEAMR